MPRIPLPSSLKSRIALFASVLLMAAIWGMAFRSAEKLRQDEQQLLAAQQLAAASFIADSIDAGIRIRKDALIQVAAGIDPAWLRRPQQLRRYLNESHTIYRLFEQGLCVLDRNGRCLADHPAEPGRTGTIYGDADFFRNATTTGRIAIGRPHSGNPGKAPAIVFAAPIGTRAGSGGVLAGTIAVAGSDLFRAVDGARTGGPGEVVVTSPQDGLCVAASNPARILRPLQEPGRNKLHDPAMPGFEGSAVTTGAAGIEELRSIERVPSTGWFVVSILPTAEAFAPTRALVRGIYSDATLLSLLVAALTWLFVHRQLAPLRNAAASLNAMSGDNAPISPLPLAGGSEITRLLESFNRLLARNARQQTALGASETRFRQMFEGSFWPAYLVDPDTQRIVDANPAAADYWGYEIAELRGMDLGRIDTATPAEIAAGHAQALACASLHGEWHQRLKCGEIRDVETFTSPLHHDASVLLYVIAHDITGRKLRDEREAVRYRIFELLARGGDLRAILDLIVRYVEHTHGRPQCSIHTVDDSGRRLRLSATLGLPAFFTAAVDGLAVAEGSGSCGTAAFRAERVIVEDIRHHPLWAATHELAARAGIAACWSEPICDAAGSVLGTIALYPRCPGGPGAADLELMRHAANLASIAIERKRNEAELHLASSVYQASDEAIIVADAANHIIAVNPAFTRVTGYTLEEVRGRDPKFLSAGRTPRAEYEAMWQALAQTGQWQGEIWNRRKNGADYAEWLTINTLRDTDGSVHRYIAVFSDITEKKRTAELVWRQANYDSLTGLPNRNLFYDRLNQEIRKMQRGKLLLALLFIDLDRFKEVNDALGHDAGDRLLREAATRVAACVREADTVSRLSGDEFTVILPGLADISRVEQVAKNIVDNLALPFDLGQQAVYVSASVGIALCPTDASDAEALLNRADQAMYAAKERGRNGFSYFTDSMQSAAQVRLQLASSLRNALADGQFELYFQPIVDLHSGRIVKAEALLRWHHPEHGLILPASFIPLAEEIGLIGEIGDWVFRESAHVAKRWYGDSQPGAAVCCPIQISVNKSPRQFLPGKQEESWLGYLRKIGLPARLIAVEITEGLLLDNGPDITAQLAELRASGMQVALDDFGTGYSAMAYLNKFRVDYVKIDQSFVQGISDDINDRAIVEAIVAMAHKLRLKVIAEGVETVAQQDFLVSIGCDYAQGYLFAKPMPQAELEALLFANAAVPLPTRQPGC